VYKRPFLELQREAPCSRAGLTAARFPEVFPGPTRVDFDRPRKTILAFTVGVR